MNHHSPLRHDTDAKLPAAAYLRYESRSDGWSGGRQAAFLAHLADNGVIDDAAQAVGMSVSGGYALRRQARGFAFDLGWQAALILARRILSDRLMTAAIRGEEARWVREDGVTTYTRQNTRLSMALLDRVNPANAAPEVLAVVVRFDCYLQMLDEGLSGQELWEMFFEEALPASDRETRARVCHSLLLSEDSEGFDEEEDEGDEGPIEYKSMEGPPMPDSPLPLGEFMQAWDPGLDPGELAGVGEGLRHVDSTHPLTQLRLTADGGKSAQPSPKRRGAGSPLDHPAQRLPQPAGYVTCTTGRRRGRATCGDVVSMPFFRPAGVMLAITTGLCVPAALSAAPAAPAPLVCAAIAPLPADLAAIAKAKPGIERETVNTSIKGPLLGGTLGCVETLDASGSKIAVMRSEEFTLQGVKGRIVYNEGSVSITLDPSRLPRRKLSSIGAGDFHCSWPTIGTNSARCEVGIDADANMRMIGLAADEGKVAGLEVHPALFKTGNDAMDADKPVRLYNAAGTAMEQRWNKGNMVFIQYLSSMMFEGPQFLSIINGLKRDEFLTVEAYERGKDKPSVRRAEASVVFGNLNTALALAEALRKK
jgi:hypothetical protein